MVIHEPVQKSFALPPLYITFLTLCRPRNARCNKRASEGDARNGSKDGGKLSESAGINRHRVGHELAEDGAGIHEVEAWRVSKVLEIRSRTRY